MAVPNTFTNGTVADADEVNENFTYLDTFSAGSVPIGTVLPWLKNYSILKTGTTTSITANKLIDSTATFTSSYLNRNVAPTGFVEVDSQGTGSNSYVELKTITFYSAETNGFYVTQLTAVFDGNGTGGTNYRRYFRVHLYFTDGTDEYTNELSSTNGGTDNPLTFTVTTKTKKCWKIIYEAHCTNQSLTYTDYGGTFNGESYCSVSAVDSTTQLALDDNLFQFSFVSGSFSYKILKTPPLGENYVECNGQVLDDEDSIYDGDTIPNLNNSNYLKGSTISGTAGTFGSTGTSYSTYSVVFVMRVK